MKLDEIQDIEVLRNELKKVMVKCIKECELENYKGEKKKTVVGEYYHYWQDEYDEFYINDNGYEIVFCCEYFEFPKEGE